MTVRPIDKKIQTLLRELIDLAEEVGRASSDTDKKLALNSVIYGASSARAAWDNYLLRQSKRRRA